MDSQRRSTANRVIVLSDKEARALFDLAAALDDFVPAKHPVRTAADKLDEQIAAQLRDLYDEAKDQLRDGLSMTLDHVQDDALNYDELARAVVDRILGVYA